MGLSGLLACHAQHPKPPADVQAPPRGKSVAPGVFQIGRIENPHITESSGVAASRQYPGVFWTHVDGGGPKKQVLYAIDREGKSLGEDLMLRRGLRNITGASITSDAVTRGVRRVLAVHQVLNSRSAK